MALHSTSKKYYKEMKYQTALDNNVPIWGMQKYKNKRSKNEEPHINIHEGKVDSGATKSHNSLTNIKK